ncbi:recombinase family protein [Ligilactobacillus sp. 110_WCHN]
MVHDNIDTTIPNEKCFFTIMSAFAELESDMISERTCDV